jgi:hypothetical protein
MPRAHPAVHDLIHVPPTSRPPQPVGISSEREVGGCVRPRRRDSEKGGQTLVVNRWNRFGKDQLSVETVSGDKVGWMDLVTGVATIERRDLTAAFDEAVDSYRTGARGRVREPALASHTSAGAPPSLPAAPAATRHANEQPWHELAMNRPGQAAQAKAEVRLAQMKDKRCSTGRSLATTVGSISDSVQPNKTQAPAICRTAPTAPIPGRSRAWITFVLAAGRRSLDPRTRAVPVLLLWLRASGISPSVQGHLHVSSQPLLGLGGAARATPQELACSAHLDLARYPPRSPDSSWLDVNGCLDRHPPGRGCEEQRRRQCICGGGAGQTPKPFPAQ